jgi:hypothetical protein
MKIIYVGQLWTGGTCRMRMQALKDLGHEINGIDTWPFSIENGGPGLLSRFLNKVGHPPDLAGVNSKICAIVENNSPDVLWIDKGLTIRPKTIQRVRGKNEGVAIVSYSPDDMAQPCNQSHAYLRSIPLYDIHFTTKSFNVGELKELGGRKVCFVGNSFDPYTHRPVSVSTDEKLLFGGRVGFVGDYERDRAEQMLDLAKTGILVRVWGPNWGAWRKRDPNLIVENRPLWGDDYAKAVCSFDINLCFLRKINRDRQTTRSIEIPACGGFMLAERTEEHMELFEEGQEAEFFSSSEELIEKVRFYLNHEDLRKKIAHAGRERCLRSGYDYSSRMSWMLDQLG